MISSLWPETIRESDSLSFVKKESNSFPWKGPKKFFSSASPRKRIFFGPFLGKEFDSFFTNDKESIVLLNFFREIAISQNKRT